MSDGSPGIVEQARVEFDRALKRNIKGLGYFMSSAPVLGASPKDRLIQRGTMNLYHYRPMADEVYRVPLLLVMATTNRGYIFDMVPGQSLVEYLLRAGYDVFMLDWEAPRADEKHLGMADYVLDFLPSAIARVQQETGEDDFTLVGTTDADHTGSLDSVHATPEEIAYLCEGANGYFRTQITPADVVWSYAGVRPLIDDGSGKPEAATRGYSLRIDGGAGEAPLLSVFGGKITTYRHLAAAAVDKLRPWLPTLSNPSTTGDAPLPGGDFPVDGITVLRETIRARYPFLEEATISRLARHYGTRVFAWMKDAGSAQDLGQDFGHGLTQAEVDYLVAQEWACTADDILWRRTKHGLRLSTAQAAALETYLRNRGTDHGEAGSNRRDDQAGVLD